LPVTLRVPLVVPAVENDDIGGLKLILARPFPRRECEDVRSRRREEAEPVLLPRRIIMLTGAVVLLRSDENDFQFMIFDFRFSILRDAQRRFDFTGASLRRLVEQKSEQVANLFLLQRINQARGHKRNGTDT